MMTVVRRSLMAFLLVGTLAGPVHADTTELMMHGARTRPVVALTFDLCQVPGKPAGFDLVLVDLLRASGTAATFFAGGDWMRSHAEETRQLAATPFFELGTHSWGHPDFRRLTAQAMATEIRRSREQLQALTGRNSDLFRLPFGTYDAAVLAALAGLDVRVIQWDVVSGDPDRAVTAARMAESVLRQVRPGSIIIMHANGRGWHTAEALPAILAGLKKKGLTPVTVSELLAPAAAAQK